MTAEYCKGAVFNEQLHCFLRAVLICPDETVCIVTNQGSSADMRGAIALAESAMPSVSWVIVAAAGTGLIDMVYYCIGEGEWRSREGGGEYMAEAQAMPYPQE